MKNGRWELDSDKRPPLVVAPDGAGPGGPSREEGVYSAQLVSVLVAADFVSLLEHGFDEVAADESAGAGHEDVGFAHKGMEKCKMLIKSGRRPRWLILNFGC